MENFKLGRYLLLITLTQFLVILIFGNIREDGNIKAALLYPVVYLFPALLFHFIHGFLIVYFNAENSNLKLLLLLLIPIAISLGLNEWLQPPAQALYRYIIIATLIVNALYFLSLMRKNKANTPSDL